MSNLRIGNAARCLRILGALLSAPGVQQTPDGAVVVLVGSVTPVVDPEVPVVVEPRQDVVGVVVVVNGLMPALGTSVAPSGMIPPLSLVVPLVGFDNGDAVPWGATPVVTGAQLVAIRPPPSNVALPVDPIPAETAGAEQLGSPSTLRLEVLEVLDMPEIPEVLEVPAMPEMPEPTELLEAVLLVVGLKPPGSIEVEPRGIPVGDPEGVEPTVPSGDVIPRPGVVNTLCAKLASQLSKTAAVTTIASRIETS